MGADRSTATRARVPVHPPLHAMVPAEVCPVCASREIVAGRLQGARGRRVDTSNFRPRRPRLLAWPRTVPLASRNEFWACADCGCVWSQLDPGQLRGLMGRDGSPAAMPASPDARGPGPAAWGAGVLIAAAGLIALCWWALA